MSKHISRSLAVITAVFATQIVLGICIIVSRSIAASQSPDARVIPILVFAPSILSFLAGGALIGRIESKSPGLWITAAILNSAIFIIDNLISGDYSFSWLSDYRAWLSIMSSVAIWMVGSVIGKQSNHWYPSESFNPKLLKYSAIAVLFIVGLNLSSWAVIHFSKWNQIARSIELRIPDDAFEILPASPSPLVAQQRVFEMTVPAGSTGIFDFYANEFSSPTFTDVTRKFSESDPGVWTLISTTSGEVTPPAQHSSAHWQDLSGQVLVSLFTRAERIDPTLEWTVSDWRVRAAVVTSQYVEPQAQIKIEDSEEIETPEAAP